MSSSRHGGLSVSKGKQFRPSLPMGVRNPFVKVKLCKTSKNSFRAGYYSHDTSVHAYSRKLDICHDNLISKLNTSTYIYIYNKLSILCMLVILMQFTQFTFMIAKRQESINKCNTCIMCGM